MATTELAGRTALVTGGGRGIGRAIVIALAQGGAHVAVLARSRGELEETVRLVAAGGGRACGHCRRRRRTRGRTGNQGGGGRARTD